MIESVSEPDDSNRKRGERKSPTLDRLPPHSLEAEMGVLGCCLQDPNECVAQCIDILKDDGKFAFYDLRHQTVYETLSAMFLDRKNIDLITVQQHLKDRQLLDQIGGIPYLSQLQDAVPSSANLAYYIDILREKHMLRRMIATCSGVVGKVFDYEGEVDTLLDEVEREVLAISRERNNVSTRTVAQVTREVIEHIEQAFERQGVISGIPTGFRKLDLVLDGMHPADYIMIAAYPSCGKTSLAMGIAQHVALEVGLPVGVFSLEMSDTSLVKRMASSLARVNLRDIRDGKLTEGDFSKLGTATAKIGNSKIHIDDRGNISIGEFTARARRMVQQHGIKLFVVDYAQLFRLPGKKNKADELDDVSKGIKAACKDLNVPIILLSQLNDEGRLKGCRAFGEDADVVAYLSRKDDKTATQPIEPMELFIKKQRNGEANVGIDMTFVKPYTRYEEAAISSEDVPE